MIELQYVTNEKTNERRLYYRTLKWRVDASGTINVFPYPVEFTEWIRVPEVEMSEASFNDLIESGGIANAP